MLWILTHLMDPHILLIIVVTCPDSSFLLYTMIVLYLNQTCPWCGANDALVKPRPRQAFKISSNAIWGRKTGETAVVRYDRGARIGSLKDDIHIHGIPYFYLTWASFGSGVRIGFTFRNQDWKPIYIQDTKLFTLYIHYLWRSYPMIASMQVFLGLLTLWWRRECIIATQEPLQTAVLGIHPHPQLGLQP